MFKSLRYKSLDMIRNDSLSFFNIYVVRKQAKSPNLEFDEQRWKVDVSRHSKKWFTTLFLTFLLSENKQNHQILSSMYRTIKYLIVGYKLFFIQTEFESKGVRTRFGSCLPLLLLTLFSFKIPPKKKKNRWFSMKEK